MRTMREWGWRGRNFWSLGKRCSLPSLICSLSSFLLSSTITISCIDCSCNEPYSRLIWQGLWNCFLILHSKERALLHHYTEEIALTFPHSLVSTVVMVNEQWMKSYADAEMRKCDHSTVRLTDRCVQRSRPCPLLNCPRSSLKSCLAERKLDMYGTT